MPYKLLYFPVRGRGEAIRMLCADNELELVEQSVGSDWPKIKPTLTFGQCPCFYDGDFELVQSNAILRYLARKHGLYGSNDKEAALIDMVNDGQEDLRSKYANLIYINYDAGKAEYVQNLPAQLASFEKVLGLNNGEKGFLVGDKISFADYNLFDLLDIHLVLASGCLDKFPLLKAFHGRMTSRGKIVKYRGTQGFKTRNINGNGKQ